MSDEFFDLSGLGETPMFIFPVGSDNPNAPKAAQTSSGPSMFTDWTKAIFGAATGGAQTYQQVTGKAPMPPQPGQRKDNTLLYAVGAVAILGLGFVLLKAKGKRK